MQLDQRRVGWLLPALSQPNLASQDYLAPGQLSAGKREFPLYSSQPNLEEKLRRERLRLEQVQQVERRRSAITVTSAVRTASAPAISVFTHGGSHNHAFQGRRYQRPNNKRKRRSKEEQEEEATVRILCGRLSTPARQYEEVEIEVPLAVYNNMRQQAAASSGRITGSGGGEERHGLLHKMGRIFARWG